MCFAAITTESPLTRGALQGNSIKPLRATLRVYLVQRGSPRVNKAAKYECCVLYRHRGKGLHRALPHIRRSDNLYSERNAQILPAHCVAPLLSRDSSVALHEVPEQ